MILRITGNYLMNSSPFFATKTLAQYMVPYLYEKQYDFCPYDPYCQLLASIPTYVYSRVAFYNDKITQEYKKIINNKVLYIRLTYIEYENPIIIERFYEKIHIIFNSHKLNIHLNCDQLDLTYSICYFNTVPSISVNIYTPKILKNLVTPGEFDIKYPNLENVYHMILDGSPFCIDGVDCKTDIMKKVTHWLFFSYVSKVKKYLQYINACEIYFGPWEPDENEDALVVDRDNTGTFAPRSFFLVKKI